MKKTVRSFIVAAVLATVLSATALACGGHGSGVHSIGRVNASGITRYVVCTVEDCVVYGPHEHDGTWYCNQSGVNWNNYEVCTVEGCDVPGLHEHDGTWYHCANYLNGGGYCGGRGRNAGKGGR